MLMASLRARPHSTFNMFKELDSIEEDKVELALSLTHSFLAIPSDKNAAVDNLFESWFPCWICNQVVVYAELNTYRIRIRMYYVNI